MCTRATRWGNLVNTDVSSLSHYTNSHRDWNTQR
jgi:hypothetical protein